MTFGSLQWNDMFKLINMIITKLNEMNYAIVFNTANNEQYMSHLNIESDAINKNLKYGLNGPNLYITSGFSYSKYISHFDLCIS